MCVCVCVCMCEVEYNELRPALARVEGRKDDRRADEEQKEQGGGDEDHLALGESLLELRGCVGGKLV